MQKFSGQIELYTGDGKGKTTAAMGLALRMAGRGGRVFIAQFLKGQESGEHFAWQRFADLVALRRYGSGHFVRDQPSPEEIALARAGWEEAARAIASGEYRLVVLDEINVAASLGLVEVELVVSALKRRPPDLEIVLTGRNAPAALIELADLVTEMVPRRHYYEKGLPARLGVEY